MSKPQFTSIIYGGKRVLLESRAAEYLCRARLATPATEETIKKPRARRRYKRRDMRAEGDG